MLKFLYSVNSDQSVKVSDIRIDWNQVLDNVALFCPDSHKQYPLTEVVRWIRPIAYLLPGLYLCLGCSSKLLLSWPMSSSPSFRHPCSSGALASSAPFCCLATSPASTYNCFLLPLILPRYSWLLSRQPIQDNRTLYNLRISTDILWRVFHILTEPVPYTFVSINRRNNEARTHIAMQPTPTTTRSIRSSLHTHAHTLSKITVFCIKLSERTTHCCRHYTNFIYPFYHISVFIWCRWVWVSESVSTARILE